MFECYADGKAAQRPIAEVKARPRRCLGGDGFAAGGVPPGGYAEGFTLVSARGWLGVTEPPTVPPRVGGFLLASCLVDPLAQPRGSAYRRRSHLVHRPAFLVVPEVNDEDRLGAGVVHPDDARGGASCQG